MPPGNSSTASGVRELHLTQGYTAIVDVADFERVEGRLWKAHLDRRGLVYAYHSWRDGIGGPVRRTYLHREIVGAPEGFQVRFKTKDTLNCRRSNLTFAGAGDAAPLRARTKLQVAA